MPRSIKQEQDILKMPVAATPPRHTSRRIGIHTSSSGGPETAAERAYRLGCNTFQICSSSPRMWRAYTLSPAQCETMSTLRTKYDLKPLVIHTSYLVNMAGAGSEFLEKSIAAFRGELERALALCADYLVLHPGSFRNVTRQVGLQTAADSIGRAADGLDLKQDGLKVAIENTAGAEYSLGGSFEQVAELIDRLRSVIPVAACIDTCHTHVSGYDIVSAEGYEQTMRQLDETVGLKNVAVWHCNDAKAARGSKLDRHQHIGQGTIGAAAFKRLLNDPRTAHSAFIAETPIDEPGDDLRNINALKSLVEGSEDGVPAKAAKRVKAKK